jgi:hypothetical protein
MTFGSVIFQVRRACRLFNEWCKLVCKGKGKYLHNVKKKKANEKEGKDGVWEIEKATSLRLETCYVCTQMFMYGSGTSLKAPYVFENLRIFFPQARNCLDSGCKMPVC